MKHYRILEKKIQKQYKIQYLKKSIIGLYYWKLHKINGKLTIYHKYNDALSEVKRIIKQKDYETPKTSYHYIDAFKLFKSVKRV